MKGAYIKYPRFNCPERKVVCVIRFLDFRVMIDHPTNFDTGEVR